jgi:glycosyltransferase involved in cell wall biosynthesis
MAAEPFSVLLPVYGGDHPAFLRRAFTSVTTDQSRSPDEVVVVCDGPLPVELDGCVEELRAGSSVPVTVTRLPANVGLGRALDAGIERCRHGIVARMGADDVSLPERFAKQMAVVESGIDLVGSAIAEIGIEEEDVRGIRRPPLTHEEIDRFARFHCPFNHPTVVFRRSAVTGAGGYEHLPGFEDYWLWVRLLADGARTANLAEPLVLYRAGGGTYERRGGLRMVGPEIELQRRMRRLGFTSRVQFARNVLIRAGWRFVPVRIRRALYGLVFRRPGTVPVDGDG